MRDGFLGRSLSDEYLSEVIEECDTITKDGMVSYDEFLSLWEQKEKEKTILRSVRSAIELERATGQTRPVCNVGTQ